jgi:hypothetical protein
MSHFASLSVSISIMMQAGELYSTGTYAASAILAESEVVEVVVKQEEEEEKVDAFGRLIGRKAAVLESKRRSKCIDGLKDREVRRRKRLQLWCEKLGLEHFPEVNADNGHTESDRVEGGGEGGGAAGRPLIKEEKVSCVGDAPILCAEVKVEIKQESPDIRVGTSLTDSVTDTAGKKRTLESEEDGKDREREREDELNAYYNPKKPSRAGLGMGGTGGTGGLGLGLGAPAFSSFVKAGSGTGTGTGVVTPYLSSFLKAGSTPAPAVVSTSASSSGSSGGGDSNSNTSSNSNSNSSHNSSRDGSDRSIPLHNPYRASLTTYERAVVSSGLEAASLGDCIDLEDADLAGEWNTWPLDRGFQHLGSAKDVDSIRHVHCVLQVE